MNMRRMKINLDPDLGDLEEMLAHVQIELEKELDEQQEKKMTSLTSIHESPKIKRTSSFNRNDERIEYRRAPKPPLNRVNSDVNSGSQSLNDFRSTQRSVDATLQNGVRDGNDLKASEEMGSQSSFQSFRSEPAPRHSMLSLQDQRRGSSSSLNGRGKTATLPRGYGSTKEKNWDEYWAQ